MRRCRSGTGHFSLVGIIICGTSTGLKRNPPPIISGSALVTLETTYLLWDGGHITWISDSPLASYNLLRGTLNHKFHATSTLQMGVWGTYL